MKRRNTVLALIALAMAPFGARSQQKSLTTARLGYLGSETASAQAKLLEALRAGLRDLGYVEGRNLVIESRWADGNYDRLPELAADLVRLKVDVLVAEGIKAGLAAKRATTTIPIVLPATADAIASGLVSSLARPGGNITGAMVFGPELAVKQLDLLREAVPRITKVAFLGNPANPNFEPTLKSLEIAAKALKLQVRAFEVRALGELESAFAAMARRQFRAVVVQGDTLFSSHLKAVALPAAARRVALAGRVEFAEAGGLIGYGANSLELYRRAASTVDKILKGARAGDLPIERATTFEFVVNLKTARALGLKLPASVLARADRVIE